MTFENFIPPRSKTVLEITGELPADFESTQEKFLEIQPACDYTISEKFEAFDKKFDAILLDSAAIDNLKNSELVELIKKAGEKLNPRGRLIFNLNNIGFAENVMAILEGKPLKFKTTLSRVELEDAINAAGLNDFNPMNAGRRMPISQNLASNAKIDLTVFAYILSATPEELPQKTSIQIAIGEKIVCGAKRVFDPLNFIATEPNISTFFHDGGEVYKLLNPEIFPVRVFINQRISFNTFTEGKIFFDKMKSAGYLYVEEMDDNPVLWREGYDANGWVNFIGVHAIQTSTEYLADLLKQFNPYVKVFANQLRKIAPLRDFREESKKNLPVRIFFGAINRDRDFQDILPILNDFAQKYGDRLEFKIIANKELYEALQSKNKILVGNPNYYNGQFIPYEKYEETLRESDIALLPLLDNEFNRCKSDLKFIECGGCGAAVLASPVVYSKTIKDGENGLIFQDKKDFAKKLKLLIDDKEKRYALATAAYNYVKNNRLLSQHYEERLDWYRELLGRLDELNAEAQKRIDKIAPDFKDEKIPEPENTAIIEGKSGPNAEIIIPDTW